MKKAVSIIFSLLCLVSCTQEEVARSGRCTVVLDIARADVPQVDVTRGLGPSLALQILTPDGTVYQDFPAGTEVDKVTLEAGVVYTVKAYTPNQDTWRTANGGRGEACFYGETTVSAGVDEVVRCSYRVPMLNYGVSLQLPEFFETLFPAYTFTVTAAGREVTLQDGDKAYFDADADGFTYALAATNADGEEHALLSRVIHGCGCGQALQCLLQL